MILSSTKIWLISLFLVFLTNLSYSQCGLTVTRTPTSSTICLGGSVTITSTVSPTGSYTYQWQSSSTSGGIYSNIVGETNPSITLNGTIAGNMYYKLNVVTAGCTTTTASTMVKTVATPSPTVYTVTGGGSYCSGGTGVSIGLNNSDATISYTLKRGTTSVQTIVSSGGPLTFNNQTTAGTYTVTASNGSCVVTMNGNAVVSINANPTVYAMSGGGNYCTGGSGLAVGLKNSQSGINYQLFLSGSPVGSPVSGVGGAISFGIQTSPGTYTAVATNSSTSCTSNMSGTATIAIVSYPNVYNLTGGGAYCSGTGGLGFTLDNSDLGVNYILKRGTTTVQTLAGTGSSLTYNNQTGAGTYTVTANNGTCTTVMNGSPTITINPNPTIYTMTTSGGYCLGGSGASIGLSKSQLGVNYQLYQSGSPIGSPVAGTGAAISFGLFTDTSGSYTSIATNTTTSCTSNMTGSVTIDINSTPNIYNVTGGGHYCSGGTGVSIGVDNSDIGINYILKRGTTTVQTLAGTGSSLTFNNQTIGGTYTVTGDNGGCSSVMNGNAVVTIDPKPTAYSVTGGGAYCPPGAGLPVGLSNSQNGTTYQLMDGINPVGTPVSGIGGQAISFGNQTTFTSYTVIATKTSNSCTNTMTGSAVISSSAPSIYNVTGGGSYCQGGVGVAVGLDNTSSGVDYQLMLAGNPVGSPISGNGSAITFGNQTTAGNYTVTATDQTTLCSTSMNGSATIVVNPLPPTPTITPSGSINICSGGSVTLTSSAANAYLWSTGATSSSIIVTTSQKDSVTITDVNGCQATSAPVTVTVTPCVFTWNGSSDFNWNNGSNWDRSFVPDNNDDAVIPSGTPHSPAVSGNVSIKSITINSGATLTLNALSTFNIFGDFTNNGTFTDNGATTIFSGTVAQSLTGASSFSSLTLNNSSGLTLNSNVTILNVLSLLNGPLATNGLLTVDLNSGNIAYNPSDNGSISGNLLVKKTVNTSSTHYLGCPLNGVTANDFNDDTPVINSSTHKTRLFTFDPNTQAYVGISNLNTALSEMTGYSLFFTTPVPKVLDFTGSYTHGATFSAITCPNTAHNSILVGNPYPSTLDWTIASGWTKTSIYDGIYFWDAPNLRYASYVNGSSVNGGTQYVPALQGFFVFTDSTSGGTASIGINNDARISSQAPALWRKGASENTINVKISGGAFSDESLIKFSDEASDNFDKSLDAFKIINPDSTPSVYSSDSRNIYSINTLSKGDKIIPLCVKTGFVGTYILTLQNSGLDFATNLILEDKVLNIKKKLSANDQYTFTSNPGDRADRFSIYVNNSAGSNGGKVLIGSYDKTINLTFNNAGNTADVKIYNLIGQQVDGIENADISSGIYSYTNSKLNEGIYVVKVSIGNEFYNGKVYIK